MGRRAFAPTPEMRRAVFSFRHGQMGHERIAARLGVTRQTLVKHFAEELEAASDAVQAELLEAMWRAAKRGKAVAIIWLARRFERARPRAEAEKPRSG